LPRLAGQRRRTPPHDRQRRLVAIAVARSQHQREATRGVERDRDHREAVLVEVRATEVGGGVDLASLTVACVVDAQQAEAVERGAGWSL
jgi:hypothetical protein